MPCVPMERAVVVVIVDEEQAGREREQWMERDMERAVVVVIKARRRALDSFMISLVVRVNAFVCEIMREICPESRRGDTLCSSHSREMTYVNEFECLTFESTL